MSQGLGSKPMPVTRRNRSGDYRMDRIYTSLKVTAAAVLYGDGTNDPHATQTTPPPGNRLTPGSDHAPVWATLNPTEAAT